MPDLVVKASDQKYCSSCGALIQHHAQICPKCGVAQPSDKKFSKVALLLLTFFMGGVGIHKFYLGKYVQGIFCLLFFWTGIPSIIALVEFLIYAFTPEETLHQKYQATMPKSSVAVVAIVIAIIFGGVFIMGILASLAIPRFIQASNKARAYESCSVLKSIAENEAAYFASHGNYTSDLSELGIQSVSNSFEYSVELLSDGFQARAVLTKPIGDADVGDVVVMYNDKTMQAMGDIEQYLPGLISE